MSGKTYQIKGGSSVKWGVDGTSELGTVLTHDVDDTAQYEPLENQQGAVTGIVIYDTETVIKLSVMAGADAARPEVGDTLMIGGVSGVVLKSSMKAAHKATVKYEIEANKWTNLSLS